MKILNGKYNVQKSKLAKEVGITRMALDNILNKKTINPGIKTLRSIARVIGCELDELGY